MIRSLAFFFVFVLAPAFSFAQKRLVFKAVSPLPEGIRYEKTVGDRSGAEIEASKIVAQLLNRGCLTASADTIILQNDTAFAHIYAGNSYSWGKVDYKYLNRPLIMQFGFEASTRGFVSTENLKRSMTRTLSYFENKGYPFAYFYWDSLVIGNDSVSGTLYFEKNILITFDTIALYGDGGISKTFLYNYLGFRPGQPYNENTIQQLNEKLLKLPFTSLVNKPQVYFVGRKAIVLLNLKKRRTDRLDGLIGFAPNTGTPGNTKLLVTGEFHLDFKNLKGSGKGFKLDWQSFRARSQTLNAGLNLPYLLNQPVGAELAVDFLKYDTLYTETRFNLGLQYLFSGLDHVTFFYEQKNTNLQTADTNSIRQKKKLGDLTSMKSFRYGIGLNTNTFDNRISPRRGYLLDVTASVFSRLLQQDERISKVRFFDPSSETYHTIYDSIRLKSYQYLIQYTIAKPWLLRKNWVLYNEFRGFHFFSPTIYFNELYRFGGNNTFRGFNEQSLFGNSVSVIQVEMRYLLSEYSFLKVFGNAAYYKDNSDRPGRIAEDIPYGFGGGINLETGGGIVNISVALGKSKFNPMDFKNAKVHFGLINYF